MEEVVADSASMQRARTSLPHEIPNGLRVGPRPSGGDWTAETYLVGK